MPMNYYIGNFQERTCLPLGCSHPESLEYTGAADRRKVWTERVPNARYEHPEGVRRRGYGLKFVHIPRKWTEGKQAGDHISRRECSAQAYVAIISRRQKERALKALT